MSKKLDQIKERKARLAAQLAELNEEEKQTEAYIQKRYEQRVVRAFRNNGLLSHEEAIILNEINQMAVRLNGESHVPVNVDLSDFDNEEVEPTNGW